MKAKQPKKGSAMSKKKNHPDVPEEPVLSTSGSIRRIRVQIRGIPPGLLMSSKAKMSENESGKQGKQLTREEEARLAAYWTGEDNERQLALPWEGLYKAICAAGKRFRFKGRESMERIVAATVACETEMIPLGLKEYQIHSRWGRIPPKTGGVVMLNRALVPQWQAGFVLLVDDEFYPADKLREVVRIAGKLVGVLANRPELKGPYGRFVVAGWEVE